MNRWCFHSDQAAASRIPCVSDFLKKFFRASIDPVFQVLAHAESCLLEALDKAHESLEDVQKAEHVAKCLSISAWLGSVTCSSLREYSISSSLGLRK